MLLKKNKQVRHKGKVVLASAVAIALFSTVGCQSQPSKVDTAKMDVLDQSRLETIFSSPVNTKWKNSRTTGVSMYRPDGTGSVDWGKGERAGSWRITGNRFCTRWEGVRDGAEACFKWVKKASGVFDLYDDSGEWAGENRIIK